MAAAAPAPTTKGHDVFISFEWSSKGLVREIYNHLNKRFSCWMDEGKIRGGDELYDKIERGLISSKVVLACVTRKYLQSANCNLEITRAHNLSTKQTPGRPKIIPLLLEKMEWLPSDVEGVRGMYTILTPKIYIKLTPDEVRRWEGASVNQLMNELRSVIQDHPPSRKQIALPPTPGRASSTKGVELRVDFHPEQFSVDRTRPEVQSWGNIRNSSRRFVLCIVPGLSGWATFDDVKKVLQPIFRRGNIRGIVQLRGVKERRTVVEVAHPNDAKDETGASGFADIHANHYSREDVEEEKVTGIAAVGDEEMTKQLKKIRDVAAIEEGGAVLIVVGPRRPVLRLHDISKE